MKKINTEEIRNINGGGTVTRTCRYCGRKFSRSYDDFLNWILFGFLYKAAFSDSFEEWHLHEVSCAAKRYL